MSSPVVLCDTKGMTNERWLECRAHGPKGDIEYTVGGSDVAAIFDPAFSDVFEKNNAALLGCGVAMCKFTGARGKSGTSDASAELVAWVRRCLNEAGVV